MAQVFFDVIGPVVDLLQIPQEERRRAVQNLEEKARFFECIKQGYLFSVKVRMTSVS